MFLQDLVEQTRGEDDVLLIREDNVVHTWSVLGASDPGYGVQRPRYLTHVGGQQQLAIQHDVTLAIVLDVFAAGAREVLVVLVSTGYGASREIVGV